MTNSLDILTKNLSQTIVGKHDAIRLNDPPFHQWSPERDPDVRRITSLGHQGPLHPSAEASVHEA
jgi:hypothetical protein